MPTTERITRESRQGYLHRAGGGWKTTAVEPVRSYSASSAGQAEIDRSAPLESSA
jgi:hypothetical protein